MIENLEKRLRFSERFLDECNKQKIGCIHNLAARLARAEFSIAKIKKYVGCEHCPYVSLSHHEAALHARLHKEPSIEWKIDSDEDDIQFLMEDIDYLENNTLPRIRKSLRSKKKDLKETERHLRSLESERKMKDKK